MEDIYALTRTTCSGRMTACSSTVNPASCTQCPGTGCTDLPCSDPSDPATCGARLCSAVEGGAGWIDDLRWAPILPSEVDGGTDDVPLTTVSLADGARRYLSQRYGANSDQVTEFAQKGVDHGITPDLGP